MGKPIDRPAGRHGSDVSQTGHKSLSGRANTVVPLSAHPFLLSCGAAVSKNLGCGEADWVETALSSGGVSRTASMFGSTLRTPSSHACPGSWNGPTGKCGLSPQLLRPRSLLRSLSPRVLRIRQVGTGGLSGGWPAVPRGVR